MSIFRLLAKLFISPKHKFKGSTEIPPDYNNLENWAAFPTLTGNDAFEVEGCPRNIDPKADVFFVHPTTYISPKHWNSPLAHKSSKRLVDDKVMKGQASVFSGAARVFAPRYRQATFYAYIDRTGSGQLARDLAFDDVSRAFDAFLKHSHGRPIILAGHSQGTEYVARLIKEQFADDALRSRLVAAYLGGPPIRLSICDEFPGIPFGETPNETGCYLTWNSVGGPLRKGMKTLWPDHSGLPVINPLSWNINAEIVSAPDNRGSIKFAGDKRQLFPGVTGARCEDGKVIVDKFKPNIFLWPRPIGKNNYHLIDYHLFYESIYSNAILRVDTHQKAGAF